MGEGVCEERRAYVWGKVCVRGGERMCGGIVCVRGGERMCGGRCV